MMERYVIDDLQDVLGELENFINLKGRKIYRVEFGL